MVQPAFLEEGVWRRAARDFRSAISRGLTVVVGLLVNIAATAAGTLWVASLDDPRWWQIVLGACAGILTGSVLVGAAVGAWTLGRTPFRQRDDARTEVERIERESGAQIARLEAELHPAFPRHAVTLDPIWYADFEYEGRPRRVLILPITFTNRDPTRRLNLGFELLWTRWWNHELSTGPYKIHEYPGRALDSTLKTPLRVEPQDTADGDLMFNGEFTSCFDFGDLMEVWVTGDYEVVLRIMDRVTGEHVQIPITTRERPETGSGAAGA